MWNTSNETTRYHKWINANNKTKPVRVKYTIKMTICQWQSKKEIKEK